MSHSNEDKPTLNDIPTESYSAWSVFLVFLKLGLTSFGGPIAHIGYFRDEFVTRRRWTDEKTFVDWVALCQFLPGPASSQLGMVLGLSRAGFAGALAAWCGFTLPSAILMILFALGISHGIPLPDGVLHGLKIVAVAVVAQAVWGMAEKLCADAKRATIMGAVTCFVLWFPNAWNQIIAILVAAIVGAILFQPKEPAEQNSASLKLSRRYGIAFLALFFLLLFGLPLLRSVSSNRTIAEVDAFYRSGALVFGGGHVVLPLLRSEVVPTGWIDDATFLSGYGAAQAVPGPLFTFAAFLGASMKGEPTGILGGAICMFAIFAPAFLLIVGVLPFWERLRHYGRMRSALDGVNAAVVGLLLAALYTPVWTSAILGPQDFALALVAFLALVFWKLPPIAVVAACAVVGWLIAIPM